MPRKPKEVTSVEALQFLSDKLKQGIREPNALAYKPHQKQIDFHESTKKEKLFIGGNRSGKTHCGVVEDIWRLSGQHPYRKVPEAPVRGRAVCVDFRQGINEILIPKFRQLMPPSLLRNGSWDDSYNTTEKKLTCANGSTLEFMTYEQAVDAFAGTSRHFVHFDEEPPKAIWNECRMRTLDVDGDMYMTMTPLLGMCVDSGTELLTQRGWLRYSEIMPDEIIMTHQGWKKLQALYINEKYSGYLNTFNGLDTYFTPEHKWLTKRGLIKENELNNNDSVLTTVENYNETSPNFWSEEFLELLGWIIGDGTIPGDSETKVVFYQNFIKYEENCDKFEKLVETCGGKWSEGTGASKGNIRYTVGGNLGRDIRKLLGRKKLLSYKYLALLSKSGLEAILRGLIGSDGTTRYNGTHEITTVSWEHSELYMAIGALAGYTVTRSEQPYVGRNTTCYKIRLWNESREIKGKTRIENALKYDGVVWCPNTEAGTFLAKRNNSVFITGNTWVFDELYEKGTKGDPFVGVTIVSINENPYLPVEARDRILASIEDPEERQARESGKFIALGGLVYKEFANSFSSGDSSPYVIPWDESLLGEIRKYDIYSSMDHGFNAPTAWLWHGVAADGTIITFAEHYKAEMVVGDHAAKVKQMEASLKIPEPLIRIADPATAQRQGVTGNSIQTEYALHGIDLSPGNNDVQAGVAKVHSYLKTNPNTGRPYWMVTDNCANLIKEMQRLRWSTYSNKKTAEDKNAQETIHKKDDHASDSLRYFINFMPDLTPYGNEKPKKKELVDYPPVERYDRNTSRSMFDDDDTSFADWDDSPGSVNSLEWQ